MSGMLGWITGNSAQKRKAAPKDAIVTLRQHLDMLQKREQHLQVQIDEQQNIARKNATTNKNAAKTAITRRRQHENTLSQTVAQISTLEQQISTIEAANINQETLKAMQKAGKAMADIHGGLTIDKVDQTMEELREQEALAKEIGEAITSNPMGQTVDEEELDGELETLRQEELDEKMLKTGTVPVSDEINRLPAAANGPLPGRAQPSREEEDQEEEFARLQAEMAL
ncbi:MAG: ESCRT-III subunit protein snf7 [Sclerophora amabilis]|nr:MAG: ESCRT-III subunit protein snf7 [Sclerophora amabilis]